MKEMGDRKIIWGNNRWKLSKLDENKPLNLRSKTNTKHKKHKEK